MTFKINYSQKILPSNVQTYVSIDYPQRWKIYKIQIDNHSTTQETNTSFYYSCPFITGTYDYICEYTITVEKETSFYELSRILYFPNPYYTSTFSVEIGTLYTAEKYKNSALPLTLIERLPAASTYKHCALLMAKQSLSELILFLNIPHLNLEKYVNNCLAEHYESLGKSLRTNISQNPMSYLSEKIEELDAKLAEINFQISVKKENLDILTTQSITEKRLVDDDLAAPAPVLSENTELLKEYDETIAANTQNDDFESTPMSTLKNPESLKEYDEIITVNTQNDHIESTPTSTLENLELLKEENETVVVKNKENNIQPSLISTLNNKEIQEKKHIRSSTNIVIEPTQIIKNRTLIKKNIPKNKSKPSNSNKCKNNDDTINAKAYKLNSQYDSDDFDEKTEHSNTNRLITWSFSAYSQIESRAQQIIHNKNIETVSIFLSLNWITFRLAEYNGLIDSQELLDDARSRLSPGAINAYLLLAAANLLGLYLSYKKEDKPSHIKKINI